MSKMQDFIGLITPQYIPLAIFGALLGAVVTIQSIPDQRFIIIIFILSLLVSAFNAFNAIADKEIDKINKPQRPLVSNKFSEKQVLIIVIIFYALAILLSSFIGIETLIIVIIITIITILYSYKPIYLKKRFLVGNLTGAIFYALLCPLIGWSLYTEFQINSIIFFFLFILGIGLSFVKDFEDTLGDGIYKIQSLPVKIGKTQSVNLIILLEVFAFSIILQSIFSGTLSIKYVFLIIMCFPFIFYTNKFRHMKNVDGDRNLFYKIICLILISQSIIIILNLI